MHLCARLNYILRYNVRPFHDGCIRTQEVSSLHFTSLHFTSFQLYSVSSCADLDSLHSHDHFDSRARFLPQLHTDIIQQQAELKGEKRKSGRRRKEKFQQQKNSP